jgi:hypothetical protein
MKQFGDPATIRSLIRRKGAPEAPAAQHLVAEVRSNDELPVRIDPAQGANPVVGAMIVEWIYDVPHKDRGAFNKFLKENEDEIRRKCSSEQVGYLGTYFTIEPGRPEYRTFWRYEDPDHMRKAWANLLADAAFAAIMRKLRYHWVQDQDRSELRCVLASAYADAKVTLDETPMLWLSLHVQKP